MNKLSKREKTLITLLVVTAIVMCSFLFVIKPVLATREEQAAEIIDLEQKVESDKKIIASRVQIEEKLKETQTKIQTAQIGFYEPMPAWAAERVVTGILYKHNFLVTKIDIGSPTPFTEESEADTSSQTPTSEGDATQEDNSASTTVHGSVANVITISASFNSSVENLINYLDEISNLPFKTSILSWDYAINDGKMEGNLVIKLYILN